MANSSPRLAAWVAEQCQRWRLKSGSGLTLLPGWELRGGTGTPTGRPAPDADCVLVVEVEDSTTPLGLRRFELTIHEVTGFTPGTPGSRWTPV